MGIKGLPDINMIGSTIDEMKLKPTQGYIGQIGY